MKCPVCDNVNTSMLCPKCGFDSSRDYEKYPTFGPVGRVPAVSARVFRTGALKNKSSTKPWRRNILRSDKVPNDFKLNYTEYTVFGSDYQRKQISSVTFLDTLAYMPDDAWDVSEAGNGTVMTWVKPNGELYDLYIGAEGGVCAGTSCEQLFAGYCCAGHITFGDAFHTENVQNMGDMFMNCYNLKDLDLSGFDTSNVQQMYYMFAYCRNFTVLDLSAFNTSNVNNMAAMFMGCGRLSELNVSRFDTSKVRVMNFMFENCEKLSTLDLSSFDVSCVTQMHSMFANCPAGGNYKDLFLKPKKEVPTEPAQREKPEKHEPAPVRPEPIPVPVKQSPKVPVWLMAVVCMLTMVLGIWVGAGVHKPEPTEPGESAQMQEPVETTDPIEPTVPSEPADQAVLELNKEDVACYYAGETFKLYVKLGDSFVSRSKVTWSTSDPNVATVENGKVIAVGKGEATITAEYNGQKATCTVRCKFETPENDEVVQSATTDWEVRPTDDVSIFVGETFRLRVTNSAGEEADVIWTMDKDGIVSIEGKTITGRAPGNVTLTTTVDGVTLTCTIRVSR